MNESKPIVFITGATSGIGRACALRFSKTHNIILIGRKEQELKSIAIQCRSNGAEVLPIMLDVRNKQQVFDAVSTLPEIWKNINVLINNAGLALGLEKEYEGNTDDWDTMIDTNIKGLLYVTRAIVPLMVERNSGDIINIGSVAGDAAYSSGNVYCATKAAVKTLSDGLRIDLADTPLRVTNIKPGLVETNFSNTRFHGDTARAKKVYEGIKPLTADDIADVVFYAASAPKHVQIAEVLVLATHQANGSIIHRNTK